MGLESATYIDELVNTNPTGSDNRNTADDHLRLIKSVLQSSFPSISGAVSASDVELSYVDGVTRAIQTQIDEKVTGSTAYKAVSTSRNGTTTLAADPSLSYSVSTSSRYVVELFLMVASSATPGFKWNFTGPTGATFDYWYHGFSSLGADESLGGGSISTNKTLTFTGSQTNYMSIKGLLATGANAGTFALQWAQSTSDAGSTAVNANSFMRVNKIA